MAYRMFEAEPYEEVTIIPAIMWPTLTPAQSQPGVSPRKVASPDELNAFYNDMERQEAVQRRLSRGKSLSMWGRRQSKKATPTSNTSSPPQKQSTLVAPPVFREIQEEDGKVEEQSDKVPSNQTRSIIPDPLGELPAWFSKEKKDWIAGPLPSHRMKYPIHNPIGPRWYKNYHLLAGHHTTPSLSIFPPTFPPMSSPSLDRSEEAIRVPGASGTPTSASPSHTPNSSQVKITDGGKPRSRKTSLTAQDTVDLLDGTDPWGQNWHHQSPYDLGGNASPLSPEPSEVNRDFGTHTHMLNVLLRI
jgi:hypothetical protein